MNNELIHQGKLIAVHKEKVTIDADHHTYFDIVKHPGGSVIAAINDKNELCLLKQWRHAVQETIWELPAGCLEPNEAPLNTAKRELEEEAGVTAKSWQSLGELIPSPGFCNERLYLYLATDLKDGTMKLDDAEKLEPHWISFDQITTMVNNEEIKDAKTLSVLHKLHFLNR